MTAPAALPNTSAPNAPVPNASAPNASAPNASAPDASAPEVPAAAAPRTIRVAHSPDSDDAFMFYALAEGKIDTEGLCYVHELQDIETLNQRARRAELEVTAVSIHAYAYLADMPVDLKAAAANAPLSSATPVEGLVAAES